jgi:protein-S-isoprenylcysteine O-methyltransferase Ste14
MEHAQRDEVVQNKRPSATRVVLNTLITAVVFPGIILFAAGDWSWLEGWIFGLWFVVMVLSTTIYLSIYDPALLAERSRLQFDENQKSWDRYVLISIYLLALAWFVIMPLDAKRFGWSPLFPAWLKVLGGVMLVVSLFFIFQSVAENTFASTMVRIQKDRKQRVISTGVYGFVRHPMYLGAVLMMFGAPLLLGSTWGLVIAVIALFVLVGRIVGEEEMLMNELEGYSDYMRRVRQRLIPLVW